MRLTTFARPILIRAMLSGRRSVLLVALVANLLLAVTFGIQEGQACSCAGSTPEEGLQKSEAVFSGVVVDVDKTQSFGPVTFDVEESWKGVSEEPVVVRGYGPGASCGIEFREGERYLVYASSRQEGDIPLGTNLCAGTKPLSYAERDLRALGPAELALPETMEPETADSTPVGGAWSASAPVVGVASAALLSLAAVGALALRRWRRPG